MAKHTWATSVTDTVATPPKLSTTDGPKGENPPETNLKLNHSSFNSLANFEYHLSTGIGNNQSCIEIFVKSH